jgi:hypothetical protein
MQLKELSRNQKLSIVMMVAVIALLFVANSVALGLIAVSPLVMYGAVGVAVTLATIMLVLTFVGKRKHSLRLPSVPLQVAKTVNPAPIKVTSPVSVQKIVEKSELEARSNSYLSSKSATAPKVNKQLVSKPKGSYLSSKPIEVSKTSKQPVTHLVPSPKIELTAAQPEAKGEKNGKIQCSNCSKEFSQPLLMADYSNPNQPDLVPHCPYCFKPTASRQKDSADEQAWKKYV